MTVSRLLPVAILALLLAIASGCRSTGPTFRTNRLESGDLQPTFPATRLRDGDRAAVIAFNCVVWSPRGEGITEVRQRLSGDDLRAVTDAMFAVFVDELRQVPGLELLPVSRIASNTYYREMDYPPGEKTTGMGLALEVGLARKVAPVGLKYIAIPHSEVDARLHSGLENLDYVLRNRNLALEDDLNRLTWALGVDYSIVVNSMITLKPDEDGAPEAAIEVVEVLVLSKEDHDEWAYNEYYEGEFRGEPDSGGPVAPATLKLVRPPTGEDFAAGAPLEDPWWQQIAVPYRQIAAVFRQRLAHLRD